MRYHCNFICSAIYACIYMHIPNVVDIRNAASGSNLENNVMKMQYIRKLHHIDVKDDVS